jgi:transposase-like protein
MKHSRKKLALLKRYLVEKVPISDLCDQHGLQPSQIYYWQNHLFEYGAAVFERKPGRQAKQAADAKDRKITQLEATVALAGLACFVLALGVLRRTVRFEVAADLLRC